MLIALTSANGTDQASAAIATPTPGRHGLYLEDLFVADEHRSRGVGRALLAAVAACAVEAGYSRVEWAVLDWNTQAAHFYRHLGASPLDEWTSYRLTGDDLTALGRRG